MSKRFILKALLGFLDVKGTYIDKKNSVATLSKRTIPTERPQFVGEASAKFSM
jgi:hypothetical protein